MKPIFLSCLLALCALASEAAVFITFDELATQPANGVVVEGVVFGFTISGLPSTEAEFNSELPVTTANLDDRVLSGPVTGLLSLQFTVPVIAFQFALVLNTFDPEQPAATISLFDPSLQPVGSIPLDTSSLVSFSEGVFSYSGPAVSKAEISISGTTAANLFAIDNLEYSTADVAVPETGSMLLCGLALLGLGLGRLRRN